MKQALVSFRLDSLTPFHLEIIALASSVGNLTVCLLTDKAIWGRAALPILNIKERVNLVRTIKGVSRVELQEEWSYLPTLEKHKPDVFVHGVNWDPGNPKEMILQYLESKGIELIEIPSSSPVSWLEPSHRSVPFTESAGDISPDSRRRSLGSLMSFRSPALAIEAHSPISALVADAASSGSKARTFDALWSSSLTDSALSGLPDIELLSVDKRLENIRQIMRVTHLPFIIDLDTGGEPDILGKRINELELAGVSACVVEDKIGLKRNSLLGNEVTQHQASINEFREKILTAKSYQKSRDFMVIARIESLILEAGMKDALERADEYVSAGADGIMIHSRQADPKEIFEFMKIFKGNHEEVPLVVVPTTFNKVSAGELGDRGASLVIYANHLLRASVASMLETATEILESGSSASSEPKMISAHQLFDLIPGEL